MADKILNLELSQEDENLLRESLTTWKEGQYAELLEEVEELKRQTIEELEEANAEYKEELKIEFSEKLVESLEEMRADLRAEVLSEMVTSNPELQILEKIKELVAPSLDENYLGNLFSEELQTLREENETLIEERELNEGAETLGELLAPYSEKTQDIVLSLIKEGNSEEVTEQFYNLIESLETLDEDDEEENEEDDFDNDEYDDETDDETDDEYDDEYDDETDDEFKESFDDDDSYINEELEDEKPIRRSSRLQEMRDMI